MSLRVCFSTPRVGDRVYVISGEENACVIGEECGRNCRTNCSQERICVCICACASVNVYAYAYVSAYVSARVWAVVCIHPKNTQW